MGLLRLERGLGTALLALLLCAAPATAEPSLEHRVKAAYVYKFLGFVRWPTEAAEGVLRVGVIGNDALATALEALEGREVGDLRVAVVRVEREADVDTCRVLVVGAPAGPRARAALERVRGEPVLTVGEAENFARGGGIVQFVLADGTVRFEVNLVSAERSGLEIDSRLLRVATAVHRAPVEP